MTERETRLRLIRGEGLNRTRLPEVEARYVYPVRGESCVYKVHTYYKGCPYVAEGHIVTEQPPSTISFRPRVAKKLNKKSPAKSDWLVASDGPVPGGVATPAKKGGAILRAVKLGTRAVGTREVLQERVGKRVRKIFYVTPEDLEREDAWVQEPGWYVMTVRPPPSWRFNDPMGPYATVDELRADAFPALEYVDDSE